MSECVTADCREKATRRVAWQWPNAGGGNYCESCAWSLNLGGDVVDPPFMADLLSFERKVLRSVEEGTQ